MVDPNEVTPSCYTSNMKLVNNKNYKLPVGQNDRIARLKLLSSSLQLTGIKEVRGLTQNARTISGSRLNRLSLRKSKSSPSQYKESSCPAPCVVIEDNKNESFACDGGKDRSELPNPFLQVSSKEPKKFQDYVITNPILQRRSSSTSLSLNPKITSNQGLKKCLSVSTLNQSLNSSYNNNHFSNAPERKMSKRVSFNNLQIREYELQLGDNPSCRSGPPITMGWKYNQKQDIPFDNLNNDGHTCESKSIRKVVHPNVRCEMLLNAGYTNAEITRSMHDIKKNRKHRSKRPESIKLSEKANKVMNDMGEKLKQVARYKDKKSEQQSLRAYTANDKANKVVDDMGEKLKQLAMNKDTKSKEQLVLIHTANDKANKVVDDMGEKLKQLAMNKDTKSKEQLVLIHTANDKANKVVDDMGEKLKQLAMNTNKKSKEQLVLAYAANDKANKVMDDMDEKLKQLAMNKGDMDEKLKQLAMNKDKKSTEQLVLAYKNGLSRSSSILTRPKLSQSYSMHSFSSFERKIL